MAQWIKPDTNIDFIGRRKSFWMLSGAAVTISIGALLVNFLLRGDALNYGTDFKGGTQIEIEFSKSVSVAQVRGILEGAGYKGAEVLEAGEGDRPNVFMLRMSEVSSFSEREEQKTRAALKRAFGDKLQRMEYRPGGDRVRLYFERGFKIAGDVEVKRSAASQPAASRPAAAAASQPTTRAAAQPAAPMAKTEAEDEDADERADFHKVREVFREAGIEIQNVLQPGRAEDNRYEVILGGLEKDMRKTFDGALGVGAVRDIPGVESVGAKMGRQLRDDGIKSVIYALLLMLVYIAFRFDFRYAPGAVVALAHDVIITTGLFALTWTEFSLPVVAALLTIAGYSINDTIVVFDRIRENVARLRDRKFPLVVNASINETLSRTLLTSVTTLFTCVAIWVVGTGILKTFAFALTAGVLVGTYSSIFIASPLVVLLNERFATRAKSR